MKMKTIQQNLWDTLKAVLRGMFIALSDNIKKDQKMTNKWHTDVTQEVGKEKQIKLKPSRRQDVLIKKNQSRS